MNTAIKVLALIVSIVPLVSLSLSCRTKATAERRAIKMVIATAQSDFTEGHYTATKNPEGPGWIVTNKGGAEYLVRGDTVYAINGWAMTWSPGIPNVRDAKISDCPNGYIRLEFLDEQQKEALTESGVPLEKRKEIYYELMKYQDEHPGEAEKSYGIFMVRYGITGELLNLIIAEGFENDWPEPDYPY